MTHYSPVVRPGYRLGVPDTVAAWREVLNTDAARYGGGGVENPGALTPEPVPAHGRETSLTVTLPPLATLWLRPA